jgi:hypothetical protein
MPIVSVALLCRLEGNKKLLQIKQLIISLSRYRDFEAIQKIIHLSDLP